MSDLTPPPPGESADDPNRPYTPPVPPVPPAPDYAAPTLPYPGAQPVQPYPGAAPVQAYPGAAPTYPGGPVSPAPTGYQAPGYPASGYAASPYQTAPYGGYGLPKNNTLAVIGMIASILGFIWVLPFIGGLVGAILGHIALGQLKTSGERGRGMALAAVIVGWAGVGIIVFIVLLAVLGTVATQSRYGV